MEDSSNNLMLETIRNECHLFYIFKKLHHDFLTAFPETFFCFYFNVCMHSSLVVGEYLWGGNFYLPFAYVFNKFEILSGITICSAQYILDNTIFYFVAFVFVSLLGCFLLCPRIFLRLVFVGFWWCLYLFSFKRWFMMEQTMFSCGFFCSWKFPFYL